MRLLIIDDDTELCQLVADYLKPMGFEVEMEHDGEHGAERATSEAWAAIILDVMMPGCDGFEVLRRIRAKSKVPVMMLTGRGEEVDRIVGVKLGQIVQRGQPIGTVGTAEGAYLAHLHFEVRQGPYINPAEGYADIPLNRLSPTAFITQHRGALADQLNPAPPFQSSSR